MLARRKPRPNLTEGFAYPKPTYVPSAAVPMKRRRARRIDREIPAETAHKHLVHKMTRCSASKLPGAGRCTSILVAAHMGRSGGTSRKAGDWTCTALLCASDPRTGQMGHHEQYDQRCGAFACWTADQRQDFAGEAVSAARVFVFGRLEGDEQKAYSDHLDRVPFLMSERTRAAFEAYLASIRIAGEAPF